VSGVMRMHARHCCCMAACSCATACDAKQGSAGGGVLFGFPALHCAYRSSVLRAGMRGARTRRLNARAPLLCCRACGRRLSAICQSAQRGSWAPQRNTLPTLGC